MNVQDILTGKQGTEQPGMWRKWAPIAVLVFISPVMAELLMGAMRLTNLWLLIPEMCVYGVGALIIRELVRRTRRGWGTMLVLGIAFGIAEECVILQTSLTPQFFPPDSFGWVAGVQWIYLVALVWYESVYAIVLPIYLTEMLFPRQRDSLWLSKRGLALASCIFILSSVGVWELWHRVGLQRYGSSTYRVPLLYVVAAILVIAVLVATALNLKGPSKPAGEIRGRAPAPWLVGLLAFGFGLAWFILIALGYIPESTFENTSPAIPVVIGILWIGAGLLVVQRVSNATGWQDRHRLALIFGAILASMLGGTLVILTATPIDIIGKFGVDLIALILLGWFSIRLRGSE